MPLDTWMSEIDDDRTLSSLRIPGSHDAGIYEEWTGNRPKPSPDAAIITQSHSIYDQLQSGYRMFDIRVYSNSRQLHVGHFAELLGKGKADFGGYGPPFTTILADIRRFLTGDGHNRECVILKISHIKSGNRDGVISAINETLGGDQSVLYKPGRPTRHATVGLTPLGELRGKCIVTYEKGFEGKDTVGTYAPVSFLNPKGADAISVLAPDKRYARLILRGEYSNKRTITNIHARQRDRLIEWERVKRDGNRRGEMMQLYWTATWHVGCQLGEQTNIRRNTDAIWTDENLGRLRTLIRTYEPAVIITDFADATKANAILGAN